MAEEKFKPIEFKDLKGEQLEKVQFILSEWEESAYVKNYFGPMVEYIEWFYGNQYSFYNKVSGNLEDLTPLIDREVKNVYNKILPIIRQLWGELCYPHKFYVEPNTIESADVKSANVGTAALLYTNDNGKFQNKVNLSMLWALICGQIYWKEWWNKNKFGYILNSSNKLVKEPGDVDFDLVNPFNVRPDCMAKSREGWRYFIEGKEIPKASLVEEFGDDAKDVPEEAKYKYSKYSFIDLEPEEKLKESTVVRIEYHEKKSNKNSKGRFMVVTSSGWLFHDGENDTPEHEIPHFQLPGILPILNKQFYDSAVRIMQQNQKQFNRYGSIVDETLSNQRMKCIVPKTAFQGGEFERYTRSGIDFVFVNPGVNPYWEKPPSPPDLIIPWLQLQENEIRNVISVRKVSMGEIPRYTQRPSRPVMRDLKRQDDIVLIPQVEELDAALAEPLKLRLQLIQKHYSAPRLVKTTGKNKEVSVIFLTGADLRDNTDVRVRPGVSSFSDKAEANEVITTMIEKGLIKDPDEALELYQMKGLEEFMEEKFVDKRQAARENEMLKDPKKAYPEVSSDDRHEVHYEVHNNERKKEEFNLWPKEGKERFFKHLEGHKVEMAKSIQKIQQIAGGQGGQAPTPAGSPIPGIGG
jgi:hypothetical protein